MNRTRREKGRIIEGLLIQETFENADREVIFGESGIYEPYTDDVSRLYRSLRSEYGRCTGHVYVDLRDGGVAAVGWAFLKRMQYEDSKDTYLRKVWVTLYRKTGDVDESGKEVIERVRLKRTT